MIPSIVHFPEHATIWLFFKERWCSIVLIYHTSVICLWAVGHDKHRHGAAFTARWHWFFCGGHTPRSVVPGSCVGSTILQRISTSASTVAEPLPSSLTVQAVCFVLAPFLAFIVSRSLDGSCSDWDGLKPWWELWFTLWWRKILNIFFLNAISSIDASFPQLSVQFIYPFVDWIISSFEGLKILVVKTMADKKLARIFCCSALCSLVSFGGQKYCCLIQFHWTMLAIHLQFLK